MKRLAILILSVLLLVPTGALACWDDDWDDWDDSDSWYDDSWDDDYWDDDYYWDDDSWDDDDDSDIAWDNELPEIVVTPDDNDDDYDWGLDDDWWRNDYGDDDDDYSDSDDFFDDWGDDDDSGSSTHIGGNSNNNNDKKDDKDKNKDKDEPMDYNPIKHDVTDKDITVDNLPDKGVHKQTGKYDCVPTCMQFASDIKLDEGVINKEQFEYNYEKEYGPSKKGIDSEDLKDFVSSTYKTSDVNTYDDYKEAIENGNPVMATVNGSEENVEHEVVVVGFPDEEDEDKDNDATEEDETEGEDDDENDDDHEVIIVLPTDEGNEDEDNDIAEEDVTESEDEDENDDERPIIVFDPATGGYQEIPFGSIHDGSGIAIEGLK